MKMRPQFNLRLRDEAQFELLRECSRVMGETMNEFVLKAIEARVEAETTTEQEG